MICLNCVSPSPAPSANFVLQQPDPTEHSHRVVYRDLVLQQLNLAMPWLLLLMAEDGTGIKG
jgi:hypothetical protein